MSLAYRKRLDTWVWFIQGKRETLIRRTEAHRLVLDGSVRYQGERPDGRAVVVAINGQMWIKTTHRFMGEPIGMTGMELVG